MLNIVVPMAGRGSRFIKAGYTVPKPLIEIYGHAMIEYVIKNVKPNQEHKFIFVCLEDHIVEFDLKNKLRKIVPSCEVVSVNQVTEGAACTVLLTEEYIDNDSPLMIVNSDQFIDVDINLYLNAFVDVDGLIMTMKADDPKWSYIRYDMTNKVYEVKEKEVISDEATVGIYNYMKGSDFVKYSKRMIEKNIRVNNEFYVAPVYNEMILDGKNIHYYNIGNESEEMHGLGTPEDLQRFMKSRKEWSRKYFCKLS